MKTVWVERPSSRQSGKSGKSLGSAMTKVGGTAKKSKTKSPSKPQAQAADISASWTSPDSGIEVLFDNNKILQVFCVMKNHFAMF